MQKREHKRKHNGSKHTIRRIANAQGTNEIIEDTILFFLL